jgi:hypothetical protein
MGFSFAAERLNGLVVNHLLFGCCRIPATVDEKLTASTAGYGLPKKSAQS